MASSTESYLWICAYLQTIHNQLNGEKNTPKVIYHLNNTFSINEESWSGRICVYSFLKF